MKNTSKIAISYPIIIIGFFIYVFTFAPSPSTIFLVYFLLYSLICIHVGLVAQNKGRNPVSFSLLSFVFTPLITGLVVAIMKNESNSKSSLMKKCPQCAEEIRAEAVKCKECGSVIS